LYWVGSGWVQFVPLLVGWVGSGHTKKDPLTTLYHPTFNDKWKKAVLAGVL